MIGQVINKLEEESRHALNLDRLLFQQLPRWLKKTAISGPRLKPRPLRYEVQYVKIHNVYGSISVLSCKVRKWDKVDTKTRFNMMHRKTVKRYFDLDQGQDRNW